MTLRHSNAWVFSAIIPAKLRDTTQKRIAKA